MADKINAIKIKQPNGSYSDQIPISVLIQNVQWDQDHSLLDVLGSVDLSSSGKGNLQHQIDELDENKISHDDFNSQLDEFLSQQIREDTKSWLEENVNTGQTIGLTTNLTISGLAADAKAVGDAIDAKTFPIDNALSDSSTNPVQNKVVASAISELNGSLESLDVLTPDIKDALLACLRNVAWADTAEGEYYYETLEMALNGGEDVEIWSGDSSDSDYVFFDGQLAGESIGSHGECTRRLQSVNTRKTLFMASGKAVRRIFNSDGATLSDYYYTPIPNDAYSIEVQYSPSSGYVAIQQLRTTEQRGVYIYENDSGWKPGGTVILPIYRRDYTIKANILSVTYRNSDATSQVTSNPKISYVLRDAFTTKNWLWKKNQTYIAGNLYATTGQGGRKATSYSDTEPCLASNDNRTSFWIDTGRTGQHSVINNSTNLRENFYAIPIPDGLSSVRAVVTPSTYYLAANLFAWDETNDRWHFISDSGWQQGTLTISLPQMPSGYNHFYMTLTCKYNSAGTAGDAPTNVDITFS